MNELATLHTEKQRKAFLHPLRSKILGMLAQNPMTVSQVAKELKVHPANLTHHFRKLQDAGLIKIHEERDIGKVVERYYRAVARSFEIQQETKGANAKVLTFLKNDLVATIPQLKADDSDDIVGWIKRAQIDEKTFQQFSKKLKDLIEEFSAESKEGHTTYALNVSLYPHAVDYGPLKGIRIKKQRTKK